MASEKECVTVNWEIRNFSFLLKVKKWVLPSPKWEVEDIERTVWGNKLVAYHSGSRIVLAMNGVDSHLIQTEVSFISSCGVVRLKGHPSNPWFYLENGALFDRNRQSNLLNDTISLCCRMRGKTLKTSEFHIVTVLHSFNHLWTIEKLASSDLHNTYIDQENFNLHICLKRDTKGYWKVIEEDQHAKDDLSVLDWTLSVKDNCGRILSTIYSSTPLFYFKTHSNNIGVTLRMKLIVAHHGRHELPASSQVVREAQLKPNSATNIAKHKNVSGALGDDLLLLYRESALSDATINTEGKSFSAHRAVLAARSPVFRAMFENNETSEGQSGVVDIDDVDSETVDRMLVYLYADSVGDLAWEEASALYYAADKYEILPLKEK